MPSKSTRPRRPTPHPHPRPNPQPTSRPEPKPHRITLPVDSSVLSAASFLPSHRQLTLTFRPSGERYRYSHVSPELWAALLAAPSKGTFLNQILKPLNLPTRRLPPEKT